MAAKKTHGHSKPPSPTYVSWTQLKARCNNPKATGYDRYGGKGITYDPRWEKFENFLKDMGIRPEGTSIERKDNDGPYCKDNCTWATLKEQQTNRRCVTKIQYEDKELSLTDWAEYTGLPFNTLVHRRRNNWTVEEMLTTPYHGRR